MRNILTTLLIAGFACSQAQNFLQEDRQPLTFKPSSFDGSSLSNVEFIQTYNFDLDILVDFDKQTISGTNTLSLVAVQDQVGEVVLDFQGIDISNAEVQDDKGNFVKATYTTYEDKILGSAISIQFPKSIAKYDKTQVRVTYETNKDAQAINWLTEAQTTTKALKYLFTQCEPIHCRSVAPLQDTPSIKSTYSAKVTVADPYVVKMSANETAPPKKSEDGKTITYTFTTSINIPSYLLAIAVGKLEFKSTGKRTGVIAEPGADALDKYAKELEDLETYLDKTEAWLTPYIWGTYTVLVLPASFPYGGMENPLLTFASPTIIVGDKSQVYVATHEIAHSWTGNEVTCRDWSNMWLNEGFTVFEERKVSGEIYGKEFAQIEAQLGNVSLWVDINNYGLQNSYSSLYPVLDGNTPDDSFSQLPYEKGFQFLTYLESLVGEDNFQKFVRIYIKKYTQKSVVYEDLKSTWEEWVNANMGDKAAGILGAVDWEKWVRAPGANPDVYKISFATDSAKKFEALADDYIKRNGESSPDNYKDYLDSKDPQLKVIFLNRLVDRQDDVTKELLKKIDADYSCTNDANPEIGQRWLPLTIALEYEEAYDGAQAYVSKYGRMKYINPVYIALVKNGRRDLADKWFRLNENFYHPIAAANLRKIIYNQVSDKDEHLINVFRQSVQMGRVIL